MLDLQESTWSVFSGALILIIGFSFVFFQKKYFCIGHQYALFLYCWHTAFCFYIYFASLNGAYDSSVYYSSSLHSPVPFGLGTSGVIYFTSIFSSWFSLSYSSTFLIFNILGFIGLLAFCSALFEITLHAHRYMRFLVHIIPLLPGLNFWTSLIGKDPLCFLAIGLTCWAALKLRARYPALLIAFSLLVIIRSYIAVILFISLVVPLTLKTNTSFFQKVCILFLLAALLLVSSYLTLSYVGFDQSLSLDTISSYLEQRMTMNIEGTTSVNLESMSVPTRLISYLYRPLFFDIEGFQGLIVSLENAALLALTFSAALIFFLKPNSVPFSGAYLFFSLYSSLCLLLLASTTANLGIAIRQKWMFLPMTIIIAISILSRPKRL
jgi:hypothetical protein